MLKSSVATSEKGDEFSATNSLWPSNLVLLLFFSFDSLVLKVD